MFLLRSCSVLGNTQNCPNKSSLNQSPVVLSEIQTLETGFDFNETQRKCGNIGKESKLDTQSRDPLFWFIPPGEYSDNAGNPTHRLPGHSEIWPRCGKMSLPSVANFYICVGKWDGLPWMVVSHHRVQVVSASVKYFLMNEECSFAASLQNILHGKKKLPKIFWKISYIMSTRTINRRMENLRITISVLGTGKC